MSYDGWTYTWENGRQLKSLSNASTSLSFKYNSDGIRTEKTVNGVTTKYTVFGDKVSFETTGSDKIHYSYDASGNLFSMNLNGTEYYYTRNAQGDITGLIDNAGNLVVSYTYDTWGKLLSTTGSLASTVGIKNPYRYRGYRYDNETGLYYLQSRYYNPEWGRFVNADGITGVVGELLALNMFAYTLNNPVNMKDPSGYLTEAATFSNPNLITISTVMAMISGSAAFALMGAVLPYVVIGIGAYALIRAVNSKPTTRASTRIKVLSDVKLKEQRSASYQYAYISNSGGMVKMGGKLTFIKALGGLGIAGASNPESPQNYNLLTSKPLGIIGFSMFFILKPPQKHVIIIT